MDETTEHIKVMDEIQGKRSTKGKAPDQHVQKLEGRIQRLEDLMVDAINILKNQWTLPAAMNEFVDGRE